MVPELRNKRGGFPDCRKGRGTGRRQRESQAFSIVGVCGLWICLLILGVCAASATSAYADLAERVDSGELMAKVAEARGRPILLNFFTTWCPSCNKEVDALSELRREYPRKELILLGISMDDTERALSRFLDKHEPGYPVHPAGRGVASSFEVSGVPKTIIYNHEGRRVYSTHGYVSAEELRRTLDRILEDR
jgi:thiol-disulfide isomerase/thioredoxin